MSRKKKKFKVEYLPIALDDLIGILDYIKQDDPRAARKFIDRIDRAIGKLASFPRMGVIPKDERLQVLGYRMLIIEDHLAFYVIKDTIVEIRRIVHGSRRYSFLIE